LQHSNCRWDFCLLCNNFLTKLHLQITTLKSTTTIHLI
jgi:hypothetical protein